MPSAFRAVTPKNEKSSDKNIHRSRATISWVQELLTLLLFSSSFGSFFLLGTEAKKKFKILDGLFSCVHPFLVHSQHVQRKHEGVGGEKEILTEPNQETSSDNS